MPILAAFALANLKHDIGLLWTWLCHRSFWQLVCMGLAVFGLIQHFELAHARSEAVRWHKQFDAEHAGRLNDRAAYTKAQADAAAKNLAQVAADKAERERITNNVSQSYEAQLASLRADLARRLQQLHNAPSSAPGGSGLPDVSAAPGKPDDPARVSIPTSLYVRGAELELQIERLQQWIAEQMKVDPNKQ